jgi:signal transduction histidine kinase
MPGSRRRSARSAIAFCALAATLVATALAVSLLLGRILPFAFFLIAVMISAWFGGTTVGAFAVLLSFAVIDFILGGPPYRFGISVPYIPRLATFTVLALPLLWVIHARHRAERALRAARDELEQRVRERTASLALTNERLLAEIDERQRGERRLARARRRARERVLEARFAAVLEERTRLAREIHDTLLQGFTGVSLQLLAAAGRLSGPPEFQASLRHVLALAQKTLADARQAVWDMRPPALEGDEFTSALRAALDRTLAGTPLGFDYTVRGVPFPLDEGIETVVFRVAQEAVANVVKHAVARTVRVTLTYDPRSVRLAVTDDGRGFLVDPDLRSYAGHWGLLGMRERASQQGARLAVRSAPGEGAKVVLRVPLRAAKVVEATRPVVAETAEGRKDEQQRVHR